MTPLYLLVLGFGGIAGASFAVAKLLFFVFMLIFVVAFYIKRDGESNAIWCFYRKRFILHGSFAAMAYRI